MSFADHSELEVLQNKQFNPLEAAQADLVLELATAAIISEAGQSLELETTTAALTGTWDRDLELPERPVVSIASVGINGLALVANADYYWNPGGQKIRRGEPFSPSQSSDWYGDDDGQIDYEMFEQGIVLEGALGATPMTWGGPDAIVTVVYTHGSAPVPNLARLVCLSAADRYLSSPTGVMQRTKSLGPFSESVMYAAPHGALTLSDEEKLLVRRAFRKRAHA